MSDRTDGARGVDGGAAPDGGAPASWGEPRTKTVAWYDPAVNLVAAQDLTGLEHVRAIQRGELPPPPFAGVVPVELISVEEGQVRLRTVPDESQLNVAGTVHGGVLCTLMDMAMGLAVRTTHGAGLVAVSVELKVSFLRPLPHDGREITLLGSVLKAGRRVSFAESHAYDADGTLVGHGTSSLATVSARIR